MTVRFLFMIYALLLSSRASAAVVLTIEPPTQSLAIGSSVNIDLTVAGLAPATALGAYNVQIIFDPAVLSFASATYGNQLDHSGFGDIQATTPAIGSVELLEVSLDAAAELEALQPSAFRLAMLKFDAVGFKNSSSIGLNLFAVSDARGNRIDANAKDGSVTIGQAVSAVPEPGSGLLLLLGLSATLLLQGLRRR